MICYHGAWKMICQHRACAVDSEVEIFAQLTLCNFGHLCWNIGNPQSLPARGFNSFPISTQPPKQLVKLHVKRPWTAASRHWGAFGIRFHPSAAIVVEHLVWRLLWPLWFPINPDELAWHWPYSAFPPCAPANAWGRRVGSPLPSVVPPLPDLCTSIRVTSASGDLAVSMQAPHATENFERSGFEMLPFCHTTKITVPLQHVRDMSIRQQWCNTGGRSGTCDPPSPFHAIGFMWGGRPEALKEGMK